MTDILCALGLATLAVNLLFLACLCVLGYKYRAQVRAAIGLAKQLVPQQQSPPPHQVRFRAPEPSSSDDEEGLPDCMLPDAPMDGRNKKTD